MKIAINFVDDKIMKIIQAEIVNLVVFFLWIFNILLHFYQRYVKINVKILLHNTFENKLILKFSLE